jgi:hypothetical protein
MTKELLSPQEYDRAARASVWTGSRVDRHVQTEFTNDTDQILATVAEHDRLVYSVGQADDTGVIQLHAMSSRAGARAHYDTVRIAADVLAWKPFTELRTGWYVFYDGVVTMGLKPGGELVDYESIVLFPMGPEDGILGELAWSIHPDAKHADRTSEEMPNPPPLTKVENLQLLDDLVEAMRTANVEAIAGLLSDDVGTSLRDYAGGRPYHDVQGNLAAIKYYEDLFKTFDVSAIELVNRVIGEWFIFAELLWTARSLNGHAPNEQVRFCTAVMYPINTAGRIHAQIGWGTDPLPAGA